MTGRCRRHHQNQCSGPARKGLCVKHREIWEAMQADWQARADAAEGRQRKPAPREAVISGEPWSEAENEALRDHSTKHARELLPGRTYAAIAAQRKRLGYARKQWTDTDDQVLHGRSNAEAAEILGRTVKGVRFRRRHLGIPNPPIVQPWTVLEDEILRHNGVASAEKLLKGRSRGAIMDRRAHLGIRRSQKGSWTPQENEIILQPGTAAELQHWLPHRSVLSITNQRAKLRRGSDSRKETP